MAATRRAGRPRGRSAFVPALLFSVFVAACGSVPANTDSKAHETGAESSPGIYRAIIELAAKRDGRHRVEWLDPQSGAWRAEEDGTTRVFTGSTYAVIDRWGARVRTGSPAFLGERPRLSLAMDPLRSYLAGTSSARGVEVRPLAEGKTELRFTRGKYPLVATIEPAAEANASELFAVPEDQVVVDEREVSIGQTATIPVTPYWFGPKLRIGGDLSVAAVVQYHSVATPAMVESGGWSLEDNVDAFIVFYEDQAAAGRTSATSSAGAPPHEVQVVSQPITSPAAQQDLAAFNGIQGDLVDSPWPRQEIRLAKGEKATVFLDATEDGGREGISFALATSLTLVHVSGDVRPQNLAALAAGLFPLPG